MVADQINIWVEDNSSDVHRDVAVKARKKTGWAGGCTIAEPRKTRENHGKNIGIMGTLWKNYRKTIGTLPIYATCMMYLPLFPYVGVVF